MKLRSFRLRIALLSAMLAGGALAGFGIASWQLIYEAKLTRLDDEIKSQLQQQSSFPLDLPVVYWQSYEKKLLPSVSGWAQADIALLVINLDGKLLHQSDNWKTSNLKVISLFPPQPSTRPCIHPGIPFSHPALGQNSSTFQKQQVEIPNHFMEHPRELPPEGRVSKIVTQRTSIGSWRVGAASSSCIHIAIAVKLQVIDNEMSTIGHAFLISVPVVLILVAISAWAVFGSALKPVHKITATIRRVTAKGLDQRIPIGIVDIEFVELIQVFNQMMERLERSFRQASRFSADAAHELKTPLAILQGELERSLHQADPGSELQQRLSNLLEEVRRLGAIMRKLLLLSLADAGQMRIYRTNVNLSTILADLVDDIEMLAPHLGVQTQIAPALYALADKDLLIQVLHNLINNAIKYNLPDGWIRFNARYQGTTVAVTIINSSNDIPAREREQIFDRFHRGDLARNHQIEGVGLGLSLSREIARAHGGDLTLDYTPGNQTSFTMTLPSVVLQKTGEVIS